MASTKVVTAIWNGQTLTAGAGDVTSSAVDLTDGYGATIGIKITNGGTGPTIAAQVQVQFSQDNSEWYDLGGPIKGTTGNSEVVSWPVTIDIGMEYVRLVGGSNTGQNVTVEADISEVTAVS